NLGTITLADSSEKSISNVFNNAGTIRHGGTGNLSFQTVGTLTNLPGALYDLQADVSIISGTFVNRGTLRKSGGSQTAIMDFSTTFRNEGAKIDVQTGTLQLASHGTSAGGTFTVAAGAVLDLTGGQDVHYTGNYTGSGLGSVRVGSGHLIVDGA